MPRPTSPILLCCCCCGANCPEDTFDVSAAPVGPIDLPGFINMTDIPDAFIAPEVVALPGGNALQLTGGALFVQSPNCCPESGVFADIMATSLGIGYQGTSPPIFADYLLTASGTAYDLFAGPDFVTPIQSGTVADAPVHRLRVWADSPGTSVVFAVDNSVVFAGSYGGGNAVITYHLDDASYLRSVTVGCTRPAPLTDRSLRVTTDGSLRITTDGSTRETT